MRDGTNLRPGLKQLNPMADDKPGNPGTHPSPDPNWGSCNSPLPEIAFASFLEHAPDAILVIDTDGQLCHANSLAEELFGYGRGELAGRPFGSLVAPHSLPAITSRCLECLTGPASRVAPQILTGLKKNQQFFALEARFSRLPLGSGVAIIVVARDISDRMRDESMFRGFLESAPDAVVVVNRAGSIVLVNALTERMFGYTRDELLGQPVEALVPERFRRAHVRDREGYSQAPRTRPMGAGQDLLGRRKDGTEFPVEISLSPLETEQGTLVTSIIRDTTERRETETRIKASLREKEVLLKEIHHRVKNNLQVTSSLLKLQSAYIQDRQALEMFSDSQNRIRSMALVHEKLYQSSDLSRVNFSEYVESLAALLFRSFGVDPNQIRLRVEAGKAFLTIETAVPCGLIVNELLSNCLKHAFPEKRAGEIRIRVVEDAASSSLVLAVSDTGVGLPPGLDITRTETLGLQLVRTLTRQIAGRLEVHTNGRTEFSVRFRHLPEPEATLPANPHEQNHAA
jgi:PAS domain S-box-containing protein